MRARAPAHARTSRMPGVAASADASRSARTTSWGSAEAASVLSAWMYTRSSPLRSASPARAALSEAVSSRSAWVGHGGSTAGLQRCEEQHQRWCACSCSCGAGCACEGTCALACTAVTPRCAIAAAAGLPVLRVRAYACSGAAPLAMGLLSSPSSADLRQWQRVHCDERAALRACVRALPRACAAACMRCQCRSAPACQ